MRPAVGAWDDPPVLGGDDDDDDDAQPLCDAHARLTMATWLTSMDCPRCGRRTWDSYRVFGCCAEELGVCVFDGDRVIGQR